MPTSSTLSPDHNHASWARAGLWTVLQYAWRSDLQPAEAAILAAHGPRLRGRVLELGCGAGRVTGHLIANGADVVGIDIAPAMVRTCRLRFPDAHFELGDLRALDRFADFQAVVAPYNVVDVLDDEERQVFLRAVRDALVPGGLFVMSSHNLACADAGGVAGPGHVRLADPLRAAKDAVRVPLRLWNHRRIREAERRGDGWALLGDCGQDFSILHYYVDRYLQEAQFRAAGFAPLAVYDGAGRRLDDADQAPESSDLHYVAEVHRGVGAFEAR